MKKLVLGTTFGMLCLGFSSFANNYPVKPANNGIAKKVIERIFTDPGLLKNTTEDARIEAAKCANKMSELIVKSIKALGIEKDGFITDSEVKKLNDYMYKHYHKQMVVLHGNDEKGLETGFHRVVNNGGIAVWKIPVKKGYKKANRVADGIFHLGLFQTIDKKRILNEDGKKNVRWRLIARALYVLLKNDLHLKDWSPKRYYRSLIRKLRAEMRTKLKQAKTTKKEKRAIRKKYLSKIRKLRREMKKVK